MSSDEYSAPVDEVEILKSGTYMQSYCPHCQMSFNKGDHVIFLVKNAEGKSGTVKLSPYLNVFNRECTICIDDQEVQDMLCLHCKKSLVVPDESCDLCGARVARILLSALTKTIPFYICMKVGCHWHGLSEKDEVKIHLDESKEW